MLTAKAACKVTGPQWKCSLLHSMHMFVLSHTVQKHILGPLLWVFWHVQAMHAYCINTRCGVQRSA